MVITWFMGLVLFGLLICNILLIADIRSARRLRRTWEKIEVELKKNTDQCEDTDNDTKNS